MSKGLFVIIEGGDGSGKTTQHELLRDKLKEDGHKVKTIDFPRYGEPSARMVEKYLNGDYGTAKEVGAYRASIFYAIDRYDASSLLLRWLNEGNIVLANRYATSNMVHQAGKIKDLAKRDQFLQWLEELEYGIFEIPKPDVVFFMNISAKISQFLALQKNNRHKNIETKNDIHENDIDHLQDALDSGRYVAKKYAWEIIDCDDGTGKMRGIEDIHSEVYSKLKQHL